ncbi:MAG: hypothetical protein ABI016_04415 [Chthoniobacterales bacterium]
MDVFSANVQREARPEKVEVFEASLDVLIGERGKESAQGRVEFRVIVRQEHDE